MSPLPLYIRVTSGMRTSEEQRQEYLKGRPWLKGGTHGKKVTSVLCPRSWHCHGLAIDIAPLKRLDTVLYAVWYATTPFNELHRIAEELGIDHPWSQDKPHFHYSSGFTLQEIIDGATVPEPEFEPAEKPSVLVRALQRLDVPLP